MNSFTTFSPEGRYSYPSPNQYANLFLTMALASFVAGYFTGYQFLTFMFWGMLLFGVFVKAVALLMKKAIRKITGEIIFETDRFIIEGTIYDLADIEKIEFTDLGNLYRQYDGFAGDKGSWPNGKDISAHISLKEGEDILIFFQLIHRGQIQDIRPQLVHYHNEGKLHFLNLIDILGIEDYNAIQIFKKSLPEGGDVKSY